MRCVARQPQSIHFCGWPISASASLLPEGAVPMSVVVSVLFVCCVVSFVGLPSAIVPAYPPMPKPAKRVFHVDVGIHSSTLMNESDVGVSTALTLQNDGTFVYVPPSGAVNDGPGTVAAA